MQKTWQYQLRINFSEKFANIIENKTNCEKLIDLNNLLDQYKASIVSQYQAFKKYVEEAEIEGIEKYPLYKWTKATIENNEKKQKYLKSYTISIKGNDLYDKDIAETLEHSLSLLIDENNIISVNKYDTNPNNNPQVPKKYL